ncbi:hypothetical protein QT973_19370 [Microcoleus sp. Z1_A1]|uniref:hypothetical protein n=1 Tax=unclassified Microcoleus TaxID=2642155 RepID=UPI002FD58AA3
MVRVHAVAPDELPILDNNHWKHLKLVVKPDRNRILWEPVTAIITGLIQPQKSDLLLAHFHDSRFFDSGAFYYQSDSSQYLS